VRVVRAAEGRKTAVRITCGGHERHDLGPSFPLSYPKACMNNYTSNHGWSLSVK